jgi:hypothetical protein
MVCCSANPLICGDTDAAASLHPNVIQFSAKFHRIGREPLENASIDENASI